MPPRRAPRRAARAHHEQRVDERNVVADDDGRGAARRGRAVHFDPEVAQRPQHHAHNGGHGRQHGAPPPRLRRLERGRAAAQAQRAHRRQRRRQQQHAHDRRHARGEQRAARHARQRAAQRARPAARSGGVRRHGRAAQRAVHKQPGRRVGLAEVLKRAAPRRRHCGRGRGAAGALHGDEEQREGGARRWACGGCVQLCRALGEDANAKTFSRRCAPRCAPSLAHQHASAAPTRHNPPAAACAVARLSPPVSRAPHPFAVAV